VNLWIGEFAPIHKLTNSPIHQLQVSLPSRALRTLRAHQMVPPGGRVLVALSGGPDSVVLLHVLLALQRLGELVVAGAAHFNHRLRDAAADDERFCRELAAELGLPIEVGGDDVRALARAQHRSLEDAARTARYAFLEAAADRGGADAIAVGHSMDDQAETFLLRLLRGAGPRGLAGIRPKAGRVIRPLLEVSRADLRAFAAEHQLAFREDTSNADVTIPRNRVRHHLLPVLQEFSPAVVEVLAREAAIAREDEDFLGRAAIDLTPGIVLTTKRGIAVDIERVGALHPALASRVIREALTRAAPGMFFGSDQILAALGLSRAADGASLSVPGLTVRRDGPRLLFLDSTPDPAPFSNSFSVSLSIPGEVALPGWAVSAQPVADGDARSFSAAAVTVAAGALKLPLTVRSRRPGDRFRPLGMGGRGRKLQDFLVDRKVARNERDTLPLVVDSDDRIVWVVGQSVAEDFRVTAPSQGVILLKARRLGGEG
jgi:tRNA(Ile)-lysidine synthase